MPLINRSEELAIIREKLPRPGGPTGSIALIGEPGIGKSCLAAVAVADAIASDTSVLVFHGDAQTCTTPFAAARALVGDLLGQDVAASGNRFRLALDRQGFDADDATTLEALLVAPAPRGSS